MDNMTHLYFSSTDEVRRQDDSRGTNYLRHHTADRDYFSPLSVVTSFHTPQEYLFANYMDDHSFCIHTPAESGLFQETFLHKHNFFELMYIYRGSARVIIEDAESTYTEGNLCLLNRSTLHRETDMAGADIVYIGIDPSLLTQWPKTFPLPFQRKSSLSRFFGENLSGPSACKKSYLDFTLLGEDVVPKITDELIQAFSEKRVGYQFDIYSSLLRLFSALEDSSVYKTSYVSLGYGRDLLAVAKAKELIEARHGVIRRAELASALNYSCEHISRIMKLHTGYTLKAYCQKAQTSEAARLLQNTNLSVSQIAASLGYENRTQFYKVFQREYRLSPAEYRKARQEH